MQNSEVDTPGRALTHERQRPEPEQQRHQDRRRDQREHLAAAPHHAVSPAETIDTVNVSTSNFDAEQGMAGGAAITVITKSGTNSSRVGVRVLQQREPEREAVLRDREAASSAHITGATLGGPIMKNKLFFFGGWEGQYQKTPPAVLLDVPPAALRAGDFSQAFNSDGIAAGHLRPDHRRSRDGTGRTPFPGQQHPGGPHRPDRAEDSGAVSRLPTCRADAGANVGGAASRATTCRTRTGSSTATTTTSRSTTTLSPQAQIWGKYSRMGATVDFAAGVPGVPTRRADG